MFIPIGLLLLIGLIFPVLAAEAPTDNPLSARIYLEQPRIVDIARRSTMPQDEFLVINDTYLSPLTNPAIPPSVLEKIRLAAEKYGISAKWILRILTCESNLNQNAVGDNGTSFCIAQFKKETWKLFSKLYGEEMDIDVLDDQIELVAWAFKNGFAFHWSCK